MNLQASECGPLFENPGTKARSATKSTSSLSDGTVHVSSSHKQLVGSLSEVATSQNDVLPPEDLVPLAIRACVRRG